MRLPPALRHQKRPQVSPHANNAKSPSFLLVRHTSSLDRLRSEICTVMGPSQEPTRTHLQKMTYLKNVLNESA